MNANVIEMSIKNLEVTSNALEKLAFYKSRNADDYALLENMAHDLYVYANKLKERSSENNNEEINCSCGNYCMSCLGMSNTDFMMY